MAASHIKRGNKWYIKAWDPDQCIGFRGPISKLAGLWAQEMKRLGRENEPPRLERDVVLLKSFVVACLGRGQDPKDIGITKRDPNARTMDDIFTLYLEHRREDALAHGHVFNETGGGWQSSQRIAREAFGALPTTAMDRAKVIAFISGYVKRGCKAASAHHYLRTFAAQACAWAAARGLMANPFGKYAFKLDAISAGRVSRCAPEREARLLKACGAMGVPWLADFIVLAIDLACREGELVALKNGDVNWDRHVITLPRTKRRRRDTKTPEMRVVLFNPKGRVAEILKRRRFAGADAYVLDLPANPSYNKSKTTRPLASRVQKLYRAWYNTVLWAFAGIDRSWGAHYPKVGTKEQRVLVDLNINLHDLRHEALTWWGELGVDREVADWLAGHCSQLMNGRYNHSGEHRARKALEEHVWPRERDRAKVVPILSQGQR